MRHLLRGRPRVRFIPQVEANECGAAALAMVLDYHGCSVPLVEARVACAISRDGASAARIVEAARGYGLTARGLRLEPSALSTIPLPAILHWDFGHFVVLERVGSRGAILVDPAHGRRHVSRAALNQAFTGIALVFEPTGQLPRRSRHSPSLARYFTVLYEQRRALLYVVSCAALLELLCLLFPVSTQIVIDHVIKPKHHAWLLPIVLVLAASGALRLLLEWVRDRVVVGLQTSLDITLMTGFVQHLLNLPLAYFEQRGAGELMARVHANGELRGISAMIALSALDAMLLLGYVGLMLAYDVRLGAVALLASLSRVFVLHAFRRGTREVTDKLLSRSGREHAAKVEALASAEMIRAAGVESAFFARYSASLVARLNGEIALKRRAASMRAITVLLDGASAAIVLWLGGIRVLAGGMTIGTFAGFLALQRLVDSPLAALAACLDRYLYGRGLVARVDDVLATPAEPNGKKVFSSMRGEIAFEGVCFRYARSAPWLFQDLSFRVRAGEKVALVGRAGEGKSTIMKLLLGVVQPESGRILLDGVDIRQLDRAALALHIGVVLQDSHLLDDSVEENLRLRIRDASQAELQHAARVACVHEVIEALPSGYRSVLGPEGTQLSGGQRQRLAIARAVVRTPRLLLLDEATSSLDLETEATVHQNLGRLGCTRLLIAHRFATVEDADRILVIEGGAIAQEGPYRSLAAQSGPFRSLVEAHPS